MVNGRIRILAGAAVILAVTLLAVFLVQGGVLRPGKSAPNLAVGQPAPVFELSDLDGDPVHLARFRGKVVLLGFWASWCPPCQEEMPSLEKLHRDFAGSDLQLLTVNVAEPPKVVAAFAEQQGLTFPVLLDTGGQVQKLYGAYQFPVFYLIDREGRIVARYLGLRDWSSDEVRQELSTMIGQ